MSKRRLLLALTVSSLLLVGSQLLLARSAGTGALTGTVTDPSAAVAPNVTVTLTNNETGQVRSVTTGADGVYRFALIPPGTYKVRFNAAAAVLQTADSTVGTTVTSQQVQGLPLSNRNYTQLLSMAPGAQASVNNATALGRATMDISVNGVDP